MFSQLRHAVETFAPQPRRSIDDSSSGELQDTHVRRTQSMDTNDQSTASPLTAAQSVDSALSIFNLRKSFVSQRPESPGTSSKRATREQHLSLEDRLRASFTIGEASNTTTPDASARVSPAPPAPTNERPSSPTSTPLPQSPPAQDDAIQPFASLPPIAEVDPVAVLEEEPVPETAPKTEEPVELPVEDIVEKLEEPSSEQLPEDPPVDDKSPEDLPLEEDLNLPTPTIDVESLQERLKLIEQRFSDVSKSFKRIQAEKRAADAILRELTPLETLSDADTLRDYLQTMLSKAEMSQAEIVRLSGKITVQDERLEEIRDMHRLESKSQSDQIETLKSRLSETEALLNASRSSVSQNEEESAKHKAELEKMQKEVNKSKETAKEEEEKRVKAISLLKTVRQKLVKAEKEKEDSLKETYLLRDKEKMEKEKDLNERNRLRKEIEVVNMEREKAIAGLRAQFDKEISTLKERQEKELVAQRGQFELEAVTSKGSYTRDLTAKTSQISQLQASLDSVTRDKNSFFDELQLRQAEVESCQSLLESIQSQNAELQYQLRELEDRVALLQEELAEAQSGQMDQTHESGISSEEVARLISTTKAKYETRVAELQRNLAATERERNDTEAEWSRKLREKTKETDELKRALGSTAKLKEQDQSITEALQREIEQLRKDRALLEQQREEMRARVDQAMVNETAVRSTLSDLDAKTKAIEQQLEEGKSREAQLRVNNKTLREELRKVQSSAALLEKQRNPGVGYWTTRGNGSQTDVRSSMSSESLPRSTSPAPEPAAPSKNDEDINMEYLRNVILQFLEHKEMRPNLVKVLSIIMRFTPQETRRLMAKV